MSERTYGLLLRVYTPKADEVSDRVERAMKHAQQTIAVGKEFPALRRVILLVPHNHDCGQTYQALAERIVSEGLHGRAEVYTFPGHHSCEVLNEGLMALRIGTSHALIVSGKAMPYLTAAALRKVDEAFEKGAKVAGLAVDELRDVVLDGRIQNTFAVWDIDALLGLDVPGFDSKGGVEEIAPLIRLARRYGNCITPIDVNGGTLDVHESASAHERHYEVMRTKLKRQEDECLRLGSDFKFIRNAIM